MSRKNLCIWTAGLYLLAMAAAALFWLPDIRTPLPAASQLDPYAAQQMSMRDDYVVDWGDFQTGCLLTTDGDGYLVWTLDGPFRALYMRVRSNQPIKDPELYYTTAPGQTYELSRRLTPAWADAAQGEYLFYLPRTVQLHQLRLDATSAAAAFLIFDELTLNPALTPGQALALDTALPARLAAVAVLPGLAALTLWACWTKRARR